MKNIDYTQFTAKGIDPKPIPPEILRIFMEGKEAEKNGNKELAKFKFAEYNHLLSECQQRLSEDEEKGGNKSL